MDHTQQAYADMLDHLARQTPAPFNPLYPVDEGDVAARELHLRVVTSAFFRYLKASVDDVNEHLPEDHKVDLLPCVTELYHALNKLLYEKMRLAAAAVRIEASRTSVNLT